MQVYDLAHVNKWSYIGYEWLFFAFFFCCAWAAMQYVRHQKR
jgi:hypothetical protein